MASIAEIFHTRKKTYTSSLRPFSGRNNLAHIAKYKYLWKRFCWEPCIIAQLHCHFVLLYCLMIPFRHFVKYRKNVIVN